MVLASIGRSLGTINGNGCSRTEIADGRRSYTVMSENRRGGLLRMILHNDGRWMMLHGDRR